MAYEAGTAFLQIVPSFSGVVEAIKAEAADWGEQAGQVFADSFKARVEAALADLPDAKVNADTSEAEARIEELRASLETLGDHRIGIDIDEADAEAELAAIRAELDLLGSRNPSIRVSVDAAKAEADLAAVALEGGAVDEALKGVEDSSGGAGGGLGGLGSDAESASASLPGLTSGLVALATTLVPIGGLALGALATLPALIAGAASGLGALKLGLTGISGAISDFGKTQVPTASSGGGGNSNAGAIQAISDAEAERNATESVTNATRELADARTNASETISADEKSIVDAVEQRNQAVTSADQQLAASGQALANARQSAADSIHSAEENLASSQEALTNAIVSGDNSVRSAEEQLESAQRNVTTALTTETEAQQALIQARQDAADQLVSNADSVADAQLQQRQTALDLQGAQTTLATAKSSGASPQELAQAQLAVDKLVQQQKDEADQYVVLQRNAAAASKAGVDGSTQVLSATQQLASAQQGVTDAQQSQSDAAIALSQAQTNAIQNVADATQSVQDATTALSEAQATGAQNIANAELANSQAAAAVDKAVADGRAAISAAETKLSQDRVKNARNVADAEKAVAVALQDQVDTLKRISLEQDQSSGGGGSTAESPAAKYAADLAALTPAGRDFVEFVTSQFEPALHGLSQSTQSALLPGLLDGLKDLIKLFPTFTPILTTAATGIGNFVKGLGGFLDTKSGIADITAIFQSGAGFMNDMGTALLDLLPSFGEIGTQAQPIVDALGQGIVDIVQDFASWVENGGFENFLHWLEENGPAIVADIEGIGSDFEAILPFVDNVGQAVLLIIDNFGQLVTAVIGAVRDIKSDIGEVKGDIEDAFDGIAKWVQDNVIDPVVGFFKDLPDDIVKGMSAGGNLLDRIFADIVSGFGKGGTWLDDHILTPIGDFFKGLADKISGFASGMWNGVGNAFINVINDIINIWDDLKFQTPGFDFLGVHSPTITISVPHIPDIPQLRADGGSVNALDPYIVGERGPELFVPNGNGNIVPNNVLASLGGTGANSEPKFGSLIGVVNAREEADVDAILRQASFKISAGQL